MYQAVKRLHVDEKTADPRRKQTSRPALPCSENALSNSYNNRSIGGAQIKGAQM